MQVEIYRDINNPELQSSWNTIHSKYNYFEQSSYDWCSIWWKCICESKQLHIVTIKDNKDIVGIAPFYVEKTIIGHVLRTFPTSFSDFITFIIDKDHGYSEIVNYIIKYLSSFSTWQLVRIEKVNSTDPLFSELKKRKNVASKHLIDCIAAKFGEITWETYFSQLSKNLKKDIRRRIRRLEENVTISIAWLETAEQFIECFQAISSLYNKRWEDDFKESFFSKENERQFFFKAVRTSFSNDRMCLIVLKAENKIIAYRLGFVQGDTFFDWNTSYDIDYESYSPGKLIIYYTLKELFKRNYKKINFMAGGYWYKRRWVLEDNNSFNSAFLISSPTVKGKLLFLYYYKYRDQLKIMYRRLMAMKLLRIISKKTR